RSAEMRRVRKIKELRTELELFLFLDRKHPEDTQIRVPQSRIAKQIASRTPKRIGGTRRKGARIIVNRPWTDTADPVDLRVHLISRLAVAGHVQSGTGDHGKRSAGISRHHAVYLPATEDILRDALVGHLLTCAERQFVPPADLEDLGTVEPRHGPIP